MIRATRFHGAGSAGFTLIEVMIAAVVLSLGALGALGAVNGASRASYRSEESQSVNDRLQAEMEQIKALPYSQIALTSAPAASSDPSDPANRVSGSQFALDRAKTNWAQMAVQGGALTGGGTIANAAVSPTPEAFTSGDVSGTIERYVVWQNDPACPDAQCPGGQDTKRIIVTASVASTASGGVRAYQELQGNVADPSTQTATPPGPDPPDDDPSSGWWTMHLTDTPCSPAGNTRQALGSSHTAHNTLGSCGGTPTGCLPVLCTLLGSLFSEKPDLMLPDGQYNGSDPTTAPIIDYSTDVTPSDGKGLRLAVPNGTLANLDCLGSTVNSNVPGLFGKVADTSLLKLPDTLLSPVLGSNPQLRVHKWVTPPIQNAGGVSLLSVGQGELDLWTKTIGASTYPGKICVWLFRRSLDATGVPVDVPVANLDLGNGVAYTAYSKSQWPTSFAKIKVPLNFSLDVASLPQNSRLGLAISVDKTGTSPGTGLQFMYDHPRYDSTLKVNFTSLIPTT